MRFKGSIRAVKIASIFFSLQLNISLNSFHWQRVITFSCTRRICHGDLAQRPAVQRTKQTRRISLNKYLNVWCHWHGIIIIIIIVVFRRGTWILRDVTQLRYDMHKKMCSIASSYISTLCPILSIYFLLNSSAKKQHSEKTLTFSSTVVCAYYPFGFD